MTTVTTVTTTLDGPRVVPVPERGIWPGLATPRHRPLRAFVAARIFRHAIAKVALRAQLADGTSLGGGGGATSPVMVVVRPVALFDRLGVDAKIGFGEAYMAGDWGTGPGTDLADLLTPLGRRLTTLVPRPLQRLRRLVECDHPADELNTHDGARDNIHRHYDLSNDLFARFLDETMTYSSARFVSAGDDLATAQRHKIDGILDYAGVGDGCDVLEIGCGWGSLAIRAAQRGARVTAITLSAEQRELAIARIAAAGVADRVEVRLQDYRNVAGSYDAVVSVEMIEAVGEQFLTSYFATIDSVLRRGGRVGLQAITLPHERMVATRHTYSWINKYIFPGGFLPSLRLIDETLATHTTLAVAERRDLGAHYAETLRRWRARFGERWAEIATFGFDETFRRMWELWLAYSEAGFRSGYLGVSQLCLARSPFTSR